MTDFYLKIGDTTSFTKTVSESDVYQFAGITGDFSPNHVNKDYMEKSSYGRLMAHGALIVGFMSTVSTQIIAHDHSVQLTLNGSDATRTSAHQFASGRHGGSVQHLAFATDDAVSLAREFRMLGFQILPQTENYYADISARFDLPETGLALLREFNILYDEDETGTALHFYSTNFGNGLFFEFIERRSGYRGFGAANAPFRLAAQRRISKLNNS